MNVLVAYASRLGSTREIADRIAARLRSHGIRTTTDSVQSVRDLGEFDGVVVGSALYAGHVLREARDFVRGHRDELAARPVWMFSSGPVGDMAVRADPVVPGEVKALLRLVAARGHRTFPGAFDRTTVDRVAFPVLERIVAKRLMPQGDWRDWPAIDEWADSIALSLQHTVSTAPTNGAGPVGAHS